MTLDNFGATTWSFGFIRVLHLVDNSVNAAPFLDISDLTTLTGERGLFSMAFDPAYETNGRFFISYVTDASPRRSTTARTSSARARCRT